jgi:DNA-directed RNA polymerase subunit E'/Rpb7
LTTFGFPKTISLRIANSKTAHSPFPTSIHTGLKWEIASTDTCRAITSIPEEGVWRWKQGDDDSELYFDAGEHARIRVENEEWTAKAPDRPTADSELVKSEQIKVEPGAITQDNSRQPDTKPPPYRIIGSMSLGGLGPKSWWE